MKKYPDEMEYGIDDLSGNQCKGQEVNDILVEEGWEPAIKFKLEGLLDGDNAAEKIKSSKFSKEEYFIISKPLIQLLGNKKDINEARKFIEELIQENCNFAIVKKLRSLLTGDNLYYRDRALFEQLLQDSLIHNTFAINEFLLERFGEPVESPAFLRYLPYRQKNIRNAQYLNAYMVKYHHPFVKSYFKFCEKLVTDANQPEELQILDKIKHVETAEELLQLNIEDNLTTSNSSSPLFHFLALKKAKLNIAEYIRKYQIAY